MSFDPLVLMSDVERATARLIDTARTLDGTGLAASSLCPGWTRGHVLTHVARNADGCTNLLTWARTGVETPQYPNGGAQRAADIEAGAGRALGVQLDDLESAARRFVEAAEQMPAEAWLATVRWTNGSAAPAAQVVWSRLREVEVHHIDLDAGYGPADWPEPFTRRLLHEVARTLSGPAVKLSAVGVEHTTDVGVPSADTPTVTGPAHTLAAWLTGRGDGTGLNVTPDGPLPPVPTWK